MAKTGVRVTYATMSADNEELQSAYDRGIEVARSWLGEKHPFYVNGEERWGEGFTEERSPIDRDIVVGLFARATRQDAKDAVAAARAFFPTWAHTPWQERVAIIRRAGELFSDRLFELAALMGFEVGKSRLEALGDAEETAEFCRYYSAIMEEHRGFSAEMGRLSDRERNRDVLRPYGVWAVISPFNFPTALAGGPAIAALLTGNVVVMKPSEHGYLSALKLYETLREAGVPAGALHVVTGPGSVVGDEFVSNPDVDGVTFTGSYEVGMRIYRSFAKDYPKPAICEMGGKNPTIVTARADLEKAAEGVARAAFGFSGQKCSACSRVYVERAVHDEFVRALAERAARLPVGNPLERGTFTGPVIDERAVAKFEEAVAEARTEGTVMAGGERLAEGDLARGNFVQPTVVEVPPDSRLFRDELFVPLVAVAPVDSLDAALKLANDTQYGLTAGLYSEDPAEIDRFLDEIQAGVVYVNRRAGATTGAWPGMQPFGGWKGSGTSGRSGGGPHYLQQYMREQSQTVIEG